MFESPDIAAKITRLSVAFVPMLLGIVCHEVAHGYAAYKLGDPTAKLQGRLTLNPIAHLDTMGSLLFIITALTGPFIIGWAKPVPVQPRYFSNPRKGMMLTSFAGPAVNFILALLFGGLYALLVSFLINGTLPLTSVSKFLLNAARIGILINITLGWFNLLPLPPLDGGHILGGLLPRALAEKYYTISRYGILILVILIASGLFRHIMGPLVDVSTDVIRMMFAIPPKLL